MAVSSLDDTDAVGATGTSRAVSRLSRVKARKVRDNICSTAAAVAFAIQPLTFETLIVDDTSTIRVDSSFLFSPRYSQSRARALSLSLFENKQVWKVKRNYMYFRSHKLLAKFIRNLALVKMKIQKMNKHVFRATLVSQNRQLCLETHSTHLSK